LKALIDSDVLLDFLDGFPAAAEELTRYRDRCVSIISWMELMAGAKTAAEEETRRGFLSHFQVLPLTSPVAEEAVILRRKHRLKLPDAIIWATAVTENCLLVSRKRKDFPANHRVCGSLIAADTASVRPTTNEHRFGRVRAKNAK
jgi:predicted nucleic acid-binding protein